MSTDWLKRVIAAVSSHEGGYGSVNRNTDGAGLSYGILQWTQRAGNLGGLLVRMRAADGLAFARIFGPSADELLKAAQAGSLAAVSGAVLWAEPWVSRFREAGAWPAFQAAQDLHALESAYVQTALAVATQLGVRTERGVALALDRAVQQGPGAVRAASNTLVSWYNADPHGLVARRPAAPRDVLAQLAWQCGERFRRLDRPLSERFGDSATIKWREVSHESAELALGEYSVRRVERHAWHACAGQVDLYETVVQRSSDILVSDKLADEQLPLQAR